MGQRSFLKPAIAVRWAGGRAGGRAEGQLGGLVNIASQLQT